MSLRQPAGDHNSSKSHRTTRFTIDSILDTSPSTRLLTDDEKSVASLVVPNDDDLASATDRDDEHGGAVPLPLYQRPDEERNQTMIDHVDEQLERIDEGRAADEETEQRRVQCSSLLARTAAAFHRRHQRQVAQLRSFSELFFAQYQQYQRQLGNHFHPDSAQPPSTVDVPHAPLLGPLPAHRLLGLDDRHRPPDVVRSTLNAVHWGVPDQGSQLPIPTSTSAHPLTSRPSSSTVDWSTDDQQSSLPLTQLGRFVDGSTVHHSTTHQTSTALGNIFHDECNVVDYSSTKWASSNNTGIKLLFLLLFTCIH